MSTSEHVESARQLLPTDDIMYYLVSGQYMSGKEDNIPVVEGEEDKIPAGWEQIGFKAPGHYKILILKRTK